MSSKTGRSRATHGTPTPKRLAAGKHTLAELRERLREAEEALRAIREGEADAVIVSGNRGEQVYSRLGAESVYRLVVETMSEAAFTTTFEGLILFCNARFAEFVEAPARAVSWAAPCSSSSSPQCAAAAESLLVDGRRQAVQQRLVFRAADGTRRARARLGHRAPAARAHPASASWRPTSPSSSARSSSSSASAARTRSCGRARSASASRATPPTTRSGTSTSPTARSAGTTRTPSRSAGPRRAGTPGSGGSSTSTPEDRERAVGGLRAAIEGTTDLWTCEYRFLRADGAWAQVYDRAHIAREPVGEAWRVVGAMMDLTERKRAEQQLFAANQRLRALMNALPGGVSFSNDRSCRRHHGQPRGTRPVRRGPRGTTSPPRRRTRTRGAGRCATSATAGRSADAELPLQRAVAENRRDPADGARDRDAQRPALVRGRLGRSRCATPGARPSAASP